MKEFFPFFSVPVSSTSPNLKKPSQAIYVPPQRKSSMQNQGLSEDNVKECEKMKPRIESGTKVISPIRKKSTRVEMRKFSFNHLRNVRFIIFKVCFQSVFTLVDFDACPPPLSSFCLFAYSI